MADDVGYAFGMFGQEVVVVLEKIGIDRYYLEGGLEH